MAKNINDATIEDLIKVPQMSEARATTIIHWRDQHGSFKSMHDLTAIPGIGETMAAQVGEFFVVGDAEADDSAEQTDEEIEASSADGEADVDGDAGEETEGEPSHQPRRTASAGRRNSSGEGGTDKEGHRLNKDGSVDKRQFNKAPGEGGPGNTADEEMSDDEKQSARG